MLLLCWRCYNSLPGIDSDNRALLPSAAAEARWTIQFTVSLILSVAARQLSSIPLMDLLYLYIGMDRGSQSCFLKNCMNGVTLLGLPSNDWMYLSHSVSNTIK